MQERIAALAAERYADEHCSLQALQAAMIHHQRALYFTPTQGTA